MTNTTFPVLAGGIKGKQGGNMMQSKADLSAVHGHVLQLEYLEQCPPILNNVGCGLHVLDYYRQKTEMDVPPEPQVTTAATTVRRRCGESHLVLCAVGRDCIAASS
jgi:hypothetical protein